MNELICLLEEIQPGVDFERCQNLIDGGYLDSLSILSIFAELEERFGITIPASEIIPENFNSAHNMWQMILRLRDAR